jgi:pectate lyase
MTQQFARRLIFGISLVCQFSICLGTEAPDVNRIVVDANGLNKSLPKAATDSNAVEVKPVITEEKQADRYLVAVREFADNVLKYGRDTYGPKHTPLFVDGLNVNTHEPVKWINPDGYKWVLSNFASQQTLLRTLDGLSTITGDPKYRDAAMQATKYMFDDLQAPNGLLYWGHRAAYDALGDKVFTEDNHHILKIHYPYYELMWQVNSEATKRFIEAYWSAHVIDWSNLDMNRIASLIEPLEEPWKHEYKGGPVFFTGKGISQLTTGTSLIYAGAMLHKLSNQEQPYVWSKRLAHRYIDTRHPKTGISAFLYNSPWLLLGDDMKEHFVDPYTTVFPINPFKIMLLQYPEDGNQVQPWIGMLLVGRMLGEEGREFTRWGLEELTAWGKASYRQKDNSFVSILTDGTCIEGYVWKIIPSGLGVAEPLTADALFFWAYALVYRATGDDFIWQMVRDIALGNSFGDIGESPTYKPQLQMDAVCSSAYGILGFLELYAKTNKLELLQIARRIGDNILDEKFHKGFFVPSSKHIYTRFDCFEPLALLHLYNAIKSRSAYVPQVWPNNPLFLPRYRYQPQGVDRRLIYTLTETAEPPLSLQEAAAIGDINMVSSLLEKGESINGSDNSYQDTALHRAAISGHKEMVEFLLAKGADINAKNSEGKTALDVALDRNQKDIVELLVAKGAEVSSIYVAARIGDLAKVRGFLEKGADVNMRDAQRKTALHIASANGHKEIVELLLANGADVNAGGYYNKTAAEYAMGANHREIVELLISKGADISPLHFAIYIKDQAKAKSLIENGADINKRTPNGTTPLSRAADIGFKDIAELLLAKGANVNAKNNWDWTPLHSAAEKGHKDIVELLLAKGADVNAKDGDDLIPLWYAEDEGNTEIAELLRKYEAKKKAEGTSSTTNTPQGTPSQDKDSQDDKDAKSAPVDPNENKTSEDAQ